MIGALAGDHIGEFLVDLAFKDKASLFGFEYVGYDAQGTFIDLVTAPVTVASASSDGGTDEYWMEENTEVADIGQQLTNCVFVCAPITVSGGGGSSPDGAYRVRFGMVSATAFGVSLRWDIPGPANDVIGPDGKRFESRDLSGRFLPGAGYFVTRGLSFIARAGTASYLTDIARQREYLLNLGFSAAEVDNVNTTFLQTNVIFSVDPFSKTDNAPPGTYVTNYRVRPAGGGPAHVIMHVSLGNNRTNQVIDGTYNVEGSGIMKVELNGSNGTISATSN
jgi:hypothetical protein